MSSSDSDQSQIRFEHEKWRDEVRLRERELDLKERAQRSEEEELKLKRGDLARARWTSPLVLAIFGAAAAAVGNMAVNWGNAVEQRSLEDTRATASLVLEREKAEAARILEVVKAANADRAAENLKFLVDTRLVSDDTTRKQIQAYLDKRQPGEGIVLPQAGAPQESARPDDSFQPLPKPCGAPPYHLDLATVLGGKVDEIQKAGRLIFQVTGNTGGVRRPEIQMAVVDAMQRQLAAPQTDNRPAFLYLLGNIVFYYGEASNYYGQFYNPYAHYTAPIFAIPGNHDGQLPLGVAGPRSLEAFMENFCATKPHVTPEAGGLPRSAMTEPNAYWTLQAPFATIIGLYTNVPEGGALDSGQREWLRNEMASAPRDKALIIALHHSPFSFSKTGPRGSAQMVQELQDAINSSHRVPNAVLSATTMNYQRIEVPVAGTKIPFIVVGNGGYFTTHRLAERPGYVDPKSGAQLLAGRDDVHGFATIEISASTISGRFISAPNTNNSDSDNVADTFTYSASPIVVAPGQAVRLTPVLQKTVEED